MNEANTCRTHITLKLQVVRRDNDHLHDEVTFTDGHIVAYLDGLQAKVYALRELQSASREELSRALRFGDALQSVLMHSLLDKAFKGE
jgi:hypothetical protein